MAAVFILLCWHLTMCWNRLLTHIITGLNKYIYIIDYCLCMHKCCSWSSLVLIHFYLQGKKFIDCCAQKNALYSLCFCTNQKCASCSSSSLVFHVTMPLMFDLFTLLLTSPLVSCTSNCPPFVSSAEGAGRETDGRTDGRADRQKRKKKEGL